MPIPLRLAADVPSRERFLRERLEADAAARAHVLEVVQDAFVDGLIALARLDPALRAGVAQAAASPADAALDARLLTRWHGLLGGSAELRRDALEGAAPPEFVAERVGQLQDWLVTDSGRELPPPAAGALVLARVIEIHPFDEHTTAIAMLAARHAMRRGGGLGYVLGEEDRGALRSAVPAARVFDTQPLTGVMETGARRALELAIAAAERRA